MSPRVLIFGTCYAPTDDKVCELRRWIELNARLNPNNIDLLLIDSNSLESDHDRRLNPLVGIFRFPDNIGHLSRGGRDGWGRAFCFGLQYAIDHGYDYVVHIEGDSLFRLPVLPIVEEMEVSATDVASIEVSSWPASSRHQTVETGLMFFSVEWLKSSRLIERYDWAKRTKYPEPEKAIRTICGADLQLMPWRGMRDDFHELTVDNVDDRGLDWLTHASLPVMERFAGASAAVWRC